MTLHLSLQLSWKTRIEIRYDLLIDTIVFSLSGLVTVPAGGGGTFLGGYLIKRFNLPCSGILKFCLLATAACIVFTLCFALNCPNLDFAGLTTPYQNSTKYVPISKTLWRRLINRSCNLGRSSHLLLALNDILLLQKDRVIFGEHLQQRLWLFEI